MSSINIFHSDAVMNMAFSTASVVPSDQGEVIYSCNETSPDQVYIIGISHRDTLRRAKGSDTLSSQIETFRISEWLIRHMDIELLLPEGFFSGKGSAENDNSAEIPSSIKDGNAAFDTKTLEQRLGSDSVYINAEMLIMNAFNVKGRQIEDADLYNAVMEKIRLLQGNGSNSYNSLFVRSGLDYLQERRTAAMLQKIPEVIEREHGEGRIKSKKAIFTIGLSHIPGIIRYLKQNRIEIDSPAFSPYKDYLSGIKLLEEKYGVTVIIPRTLADNRDLLRLTGLLAPH